MCSHLQLHLAGTARRSRVHLVLNRHRLAPLLLHEEVLRLPRLRAFLEHEDRPIVVDHVALRLDVIVPQARLPQLGDLFRFVARRRPIDGNERHQRFALLGGLQHALRIGHVQFAEVDLRLGAQVLGQFVVGQRFLVFLMCRLRFTRKATSVT